MKKSEKIQLSKMILVKSGKFAYANFDIRGPVHLSGRNRTGKTSLINAIQFGIIYNLNDGDWDGHSIDATRKHYFGTNSLIGFEFKTEFGPRSLLLRGLGPLDRYRVKRDYWHGRLDEDRLLQFDKNDNATESRSADDIEQYLIEIDANQIKTAIQFDSFLIDEVGILKKARRRDLRSFRRLFKDILGVSGIQDDDLKDLIVSLWTTVPQREIDLTRDSDQFHKLRTEKERLDKMETQLEHIQTVISAHEKMEERLHVVSQQCADLLNSMPVYRKEQLASQHQLEETIQDIAKGIADAELDYKKMRDSYGEAKEQKGEFKAELKRTQELLQKAEKVDPDLKMHIYELRAEKEHLSILMQSENMAVEGTALSTKDILNNVQRQIGVAKRELEGDLTLHRQLVEQGVTQEELSDASRVFNPELLETTPEGDEAAVSGDAVSSLIKSAGSDNIAIEGLSISLDAISKKRIPELTPISNLEDKIELLKEEEERLESTIELLKNRDEIDRTLKELYTKVKNAEDDLKLLLEIDSHRADYEKTQSHLDACQTQVIATEKAMKDAREMQDSLKNDDRKYKTELNELKTKLEEVEALVDNVRNQPFLISVKPSTEIPSDSIQRTIKTVQRESSAVWNESLKLDKMFREIYSELGRSAMYVDIKDSANSLRNESSQHIHKKEIHRSDIQGFFSSLTDRLQRFIEGYEHIQSEIRKINSRLSNTSISDLDSLRIVVKIVDSALYNSIKSLLKESEGQTTFFEDKTSSTERLGKLLTQGKISLSKFIGLGFEIVDEGDKVIYSNLKKIESTGTTLAIKVAIYSEIIGNMIVENATIPIFIDEVGKLDDDNFKEIINYLIGRNLTPVTANPKATWIIPEFYHLSNRGNDKILDYKNRQSWNRR